jgi:fused signal recognition particle receptor
MSSRRLTRAVAGKSKIDDEVLDNLEEVLVSSDVGSGYNPEDN